MAGETIECTLCEHSIVMNKKGRVKKREIIFYTLF